MKICTVLLIVLFCYPGGGSSTETGWTYNEQDKWPPSQCKGRHQSPIPIDHVTAKHFALIRLNGDYSQEIQANLTNSGHTVDIAFLNETNLPSIIHGGGFHGEYILKSFHFHWYSEHTVHKIRYPLEGHFVHWAKKYGTFENALKFPDGIAVIAVFYNVTRNSNPAFTPIIEEMPLVAHNVHHSIQLQNPVTVKDFLPENTTNFYRYYGSLTTPNCNEVVIWTLFSTPSYLSRQQFLRLTHIWTDDNSLLKSNYRQLQELNGRAVYFNSG